MTTPTGKNASITVNSTTLASADCLQSTALNDAVNEVIYQCSGYDKGAAGTRAITSSFSCVLSASDTTKVAALAPGTAITTFTYYPAGNTATYIKATATDGIIVSANMAAAPNSMITLDVGLRLNNITQGAAT